MNEIKFIYFDIGGVLVKDFSASNKWDQMTDKWGIPKDKKKMFDELYDEFEKEVCVGRSVEEFLPIAKEKFGIKFPKNYSLGIDFVNRFYKNEGLEKIIFDIKNDYQFGLLTNMYPKTLQMLRERNLIPDIDWATVIDSSVEKCKKPEEQIYICAQNRAQVKPDEILFVDNILKNLEIPKEMGWKTFLFDSANYEESNRKLSGVLRF